MEQEAHPDQLLSSGRRIGAENNGQTTTRRSTMTPKQILVMRHAEKLADTRADWYWFAGITEISRDWLWH